MVWYNQSGDKVAEKIEILDEESLMYPLYLVQSSVGYTLRYL